MSAVSTATLVLGLAACNAGFPGDDTLSGHSTAHAGQSQPGRHSVLPEPCEAPDAERLAGLLPDASATVLAGERQLTYDSGRRFACSWRYQTDDVSYALTVDFLRVLSYDPEISDDAQAQADFAGMAAEAGISLDDTDGPPGPSTAGGTTKPADAGNDPATPAESDTDGGDGSDSGSQPPAGDLAPRELNDLADAGYLNDRLSPDGTRRVVSLTFRSSNVIVAIDYAKAVSEAGPVLPPDPDSGDRTGEDPTDGLEDLLAPSDSPDADGEPTDPLDSAVLQEELRRLAGQLATLFED